MSTKFLTPTLHFRYFERALVKELTAFFGKRFGLNGVRIRNAIYKADGVQISFEKGLVEYGSTVMDSLPEGCRPVVIIGRPYNSADPHLNLDLTEKLLTQNVMPIPLDMLDLSITRSLTTTATCTGPTVRR